MTTEGQLLALDIWLQPVDVESFVDNLCDYIRNHFTVVNEIEHKFAPQGRTIVLILSESHFAVHTYPEHNYISVDLYICNMGVNLAKVANDILNMTSVQHVESRIKKRGVRNE